METNNDKAQAIANEVKKMVMELQRMGRTDLLLRAISVPVLEELRIEAAKTSLSRLVNPTDNAINEKCSRIKAAFAEHMDEYALKYYMISSHVTRYFNNSARVWFKRLKVITLPRHLVIKEYE